MWNKLKSLVSDYLKGEELERYESLLYNETAPSIKSCTVCTKQVFDIYSLRAGLPSSLSGKIRGFNKLLKELDKTKDSKIFIHRVSSSNKKLVIFTNCDITRVMGILTFSERKYDEKK
ncbi:hypothetical protein [Nodularia chucula]|uniref:hypothetical protein n=1 Tax=Nodularia chucula TaxID=3093667 RepID=UPI0039C652CD